MLGRAHIGRDVFIVTLYNSRHQQLPRYIVRAPKLLLPSGDQDRKFAFALAVPTQLLVERFGWRMHCDTSETTIIRFNSNDFLDTPRLWPQVFYTKPPRPISLPMPLGYPLEFRRRRVQRRPTVAYPRLPGDFFFRVMAALPQELFAELSVRLCREGRGPWLPDPEDEVAEPATQT